VSATVTARVRPPGLGSPHRSEEPARRPEGLRNGGPNRVTRGGARGSTRGPPRRPPQLFRLLRRPCGLPPPHLDRVPGCPRLRGGDAAKQPRPDAGSRLSPAPTTGAVFSGGCAPALRRRGVGAASCASFFPRGADTFNSPLSASFSATSSLSVPTATSHTSASAFSVVAVASSFP
jgi:hypothetical protein